MPPQTKPELSMSRVSKVVLRTCNRDIHACMHTYIHTHIQTDRHTVGCHRQHYHAASWIVEMMKMPNVSITDLFRQPLQKRTKMSQSRSRRDHHTSHKRSDWPARSPHVCGGSVSTERERRSAVTWTDCPPAPPSRRHVVVRLAGHVASLTGNQATAFVRACVRRNASKPRSDASNLVFYCPPAKLPDSHRQ